jgi:ribosome-associated protein YbcJ (S4-like RNA binding protein)
MNSGEIETNTTMQRLICDGDAMSRRRKVLRGSDRIKVAGGLYVIRQALGADLGS